MPAKIFLSEVSCRPFSADQGPMQWRIFMTEAPKTTAAPKTSAAEKRKSSSKANALQQPLQPSQELAAIIGNGPVPRAEAVSKVWAYIKANKLQNPKNRREILADEKLQKVFGKASVTMFEMNKPFAQHLK
jgi:upstream activation factor subunit UAF30